MRDLGAILDTIMSLVPHVCAACQSARYHIMNIGKIRRCPDRDSYQKLVRIFVTLQLDLNNGLLEGLTGAQSANCS